MFCPNCGERIPDDSRFCEKCGANLARGAQARPQPQPRPQAPRHRAAAPAAAGGDWCLTRLPECRVPVVGRFGLNIGQVVAVGLMALAMLLSLICVDIGVSWLRLLAAAVIGGALFAHTPTRDWDMGCAISFYGLFFMVKCLAGYVGAGFFKVVLYAAVFAIVALVWLWMGNVIESRKGGKLALAALMAVGALCAFISFCTSVGSSFRGALTYIADMCVLGGLCAYFLLTDDGVASRARCFPRGLIGGVLGGAAKAGFQQARQPQGNGQPEQAAYPRQGDARPRQGAESAPRSQRALMDLNGFLVELSSREMGDARANRIFDEDGAVVAAFADTGSGCELVDTSNHVLSSVRQDGGLRASGQADVFNAQGAMIATCAWHSGACTVMDGRGRSLCRIAMNRAADGYDILSMEELKVGEVLDAGDRVRVRLDERILGGYRLIMATAAIVAALAR